MSTMRNPAGGPTGSEPREMVCTELVALVTEYLEQTIAEAERERFEAHMGNCDWCERYVEQTRAIISALGRIGSEPVDSAAWDQALEAFRGSDARP